MRNTRTPAFTAALVLSIVGILTMIGSHATFAKGPNDPATECLIQLQGSDNAVLGTSLACKDGDPCDSGPAGDDRCDIRIAACVNQADPALPACTAPAFLSSAKIKGEVSVKVPSLLAGPQCTPFVSVSVPIKRKKNGTAVAGKSKRVLKGEAKAPKDTSPRKDADKWTLQCLPSS